MTRMPPFNGRRDLTGRWQSYTPVASGWTVGSSVLTGWWTRIGDTIHIDIRAVMSGGFGFGTGAAVAVSLPVPYAGPAGKPVDCWAVDAGSNSYDLAAAIGGSYVTAYLRIVAGAVAGPLGLIKNSDPFAWTAGDEIRWAGTYRGAA